MTNREAIELINTFKCKCECNDDGIDGCDKQKDCEYYLAIEALKNYNDFRNELCHKCGNYKEAHLGACKYCRWE